MIATLALSLSLAVSAAQDATPVPQKAQRSIDRALQWLVAAQNHDGSWGDDRGSRGDISNTCIATLALLSTGDTVTRGKHAARIRRAVDYVFLRARRSGGDVDLLDQGTLMQRKLGPSVDLYLAALLLSQVIGLDLDGWERIEMQKVLRKMTNRISGLQRNNGAFEVSYEPMLTTVLAWLALRQVHSAGIAIDGASPEKVLEYLKKECVDANKGVFREAKWNNQMRFVTHSGGLRVVCGMGEGDTSLAQKAMQVLLAMRFDQDVGGRAGGEEFLGALFATQALHMEEEAPFPKWYAKITDALMACQNADGSWVGHHCITGRVFCTSCSIMTMGTPTKLIPMIER
jgi:prenyltransferase beta subunit